MIQVDTLTARDILIYVGLPVAGALLGHLWTKYRGRLVTLRWTTDWQPMAFATEDFGWGKVEILYNGKPVGHIHMLHAQITNESQTDLSNVELRCVLNDGAWTLRSAAQVRGSLEAAPFAPKYAALVVESATRTFTEQEIATWSKRTDFVIPVLNRGAMVDVKLLVGRADYLTPSVTIHCDHIGVRLKQEPPSQQFWGVNQNRAAWIGLLVGAGVVVATVQMGNATWWGAIGLWFAGAASIALGALITRVWRWLSRMAG